MRASAMSLGRSVRAELAVQLAMCVRSALRKIRRRPIPRRQMTAGGMLGRYPQGELPSRLNECTCISAQSLPDFVVFYALSLNPPRRFVRQRASSPGSSFMMQSSLPIALIACIGSGDDPGRDQIEQVAAKLDADIFVGARGQLRRAWPGWTRQSSQNLARLMLVGEPQPSGLMPATVRAV